MDFIKYLQYKKRKKVFLKQKFTKEEKHIM